MFAEIKQLLDEKTKKLEEIKSIENTIVRLQLACLHLNVVKGLNHPNSWEECTHCNDCDDCNIGWGWCSTHKVLD